MLALVQLVRVQRPPLAVGGTSRVGDDVMDVELRLTAAVHVVKESCGDEPAGHLGHLAPAVPDPPFRNVALRPGEGRGCCLAHRGHQPCVPAHERQDRHRLGHGHGDVPTCPVFTSFGVQHDAVGEFAGQHLFEPLGIDRPGQTQLCGTLACPGTDPFCLIGGIIVVASVIGSCVGGRTDRRNRDHCLPCGVPGVARTVTLLAFPSNCVRQLSVASR